MRIKSLFSTKRRILVTAGAGALVLASAGIAFAAFNSNHATGTGEGKVGTPTPGISITEVTTGATALTPTTGKQTFTFTVHNTTAKTKTLTALWSLDHTGSTPTTALLVTNATHTAITGCLAKWFVVDYQGTTASTVNPFPFTLPASGTYTLIYTLHFVSTTTPTVTQGACGTAVPTIHVTVNKA